MLWQRSPEAWGRAAFDLGLVGASIFKIGQVSRLANAGKIGRIGQEATGLSTSLRTMQEIGAFGRGAENINAGISLSTKLKQLETIQQTAIKMKILPMVVRYYNAERMATYPCPTRGAAYVTEYNPDTGKVLGWNECYDQLGNINRVHPKDINGQSLTSPHYPLIEQKLIQ